jgi:hypothetical protein
VHAHTLIVQAPTARKPHSNHVHIVSSEDESRIKRPALSLGRESKLTMLSERITKIITFLQADTSIEDIAKNPVVRHPHNTSRIVPERLPPTTIKELLVLEPAHHAGASLRSLS